MIIEDSPPHHPPTHPDVRTPRTQGAAPPGTDPKGEPDTPPATATATGPIAPEPALTVEAIATAVAQRLAPPPLMPLSETTREIIAQGLAATTLARYDRAAEGFKAWCAQNGTDPLARDPHAVANYLAGVAKERGWKAQTVQAHIAGINNWLARETDQKLPPCRALTLMSRGVGKTNPAEPRYTEIWDLSLATYFFLETMEENSDLNERELIGKLLVLLEASGLRLCDQLGINLKTSVLEGPRHTMVLQTLTKESQKLRWVNCHIDGDPRHPKICPHCVTKEMLKRRPPLYSVDQFYVFLRGTKNVGHAGEAISHDSLRNCMHEVMHSAGVGREFTAHSCRHASASKAVELGVSLPALFTQFRWKPDSKVPIKHYIRIRRKARSAAITTGVFNSFVLDTASMIFDERGHVCLEEEQEGDD